MKSKEGLIRIVQQNRNKDQGSVHSLASPFKSDDLTKLMDKTWFPTPIETRDISTGPKPSSPLKKTVS